MCLLLCAEEEDDDDSCVALEREMTVAQCLFLSVSPTAERNVESDFKSVFYIGIPHHVLFPCPLLLQRVCLF